MSKKTDKTIVTAVDRAVKGRPQEESSLLTVLREVNDSLRELPDDALRYVSRKLNVPLSRVYSVASLSTAFTPGPRGEHTIRVCTGTSCHVRRSRRIVDELSRRLQVEPGCTTEDGRFTLETVNCLGACSLGPTVMVDNRYYRASAGSIDRLMADLERGELPDSAFAVPESAVARAVARSRVTGKDIGIVVCGGAGCNARASKEVTAEFRRALRDLEITDQVRLQVTGCLGFCACGPVVIIRPRNLLYQNVTKRDVSEIVSRSVVGGEVVERLQYQDAATGLLVPIQKHIPFFARQTRNVLGDNEFLTPGAIADYRARDGYTALRKALKMEPEAVSDEVRAAGLRGRGDEGADTGWKWEACRCAAAEKKYVVCPAAENAPGPSIHARLLEANPHRVIEGMTIGAYAIGATEGFILAENESDPAIVNVNRAIAEARGQGVLGMNILGSGFDFDVRIVRGLAVEPGVDADGTVASRGSPWNVDTAETWANVPLILRNGAEWFAGTGTDDSKGTKVLLLAGAIEYPGLIEVPMGTAIGEIVTAIGGGVLKCRGLKAILVGGFSGGCLPASLLDLRFGFEELKEAGIESMGTGSVMVLDERTCMVSMAKYFIDFVVEQSYGRCVPCPDGVYRLQQILERIIGGNGDATDVDKLMTVAFELQDQTKIGPIVGILRHFREEFLVHCRDKHCPAGVCRSLVTYRIDAEKCTGCMLCSRMCPHKAIGGERGNAHFVNGDKCTKCGICLDACMFGAVRVD